MVVAGEEVAEHLERLRFGAFRQFLRSPSLANVAYGVITFAFAEQRPCKGETSFGARGLTASKTENGSGVAPLFPKPRLRAPSHQAAAGPAWVISNETRVTAETGFSRVSQNEPFDAFLGSRIADPFFYRASFGNLCLSRQIERVLYRGQISGEWRGDLSLMS